MKEGLAFVSWLLNLEMWLFKPEWLEEQPWMGITLLWDLRYLGGNMETKDHKRGSRAPDVGRKATEGNMLNTHLLQPLENVQSSYRIMRWAHSYPVVWQSYRCGMQCYEFELVNHFPHYLTSLSFFLCFNIANTKKNIFQFVPSSWNSWQNKPLKNWNFLIWSKKILNMVHCQDEFQLLGTKGRIH